MADISNECAFDLGQAEAAGQRFAARASAREANAVALDNGHYSSIESPDRLAMRVNRILAHAAQANPDGDEAGLPKPLRNLAGQAVRPEEVDDALFERVIGASRDFLFIEFLEQGQAAARAVGRVVTRLGGGSESFGTGFMVSPALMMTNHHVLPDAAAAQRSTIEMDFARDGARRTRNTQAFALRPDLLFVTDIQLDMSIVAVEPNSTLGVAMTTYGWLPLIPDEGKIVVGELVNVVQHPLGELKQVVVRQSELIDMPAPEQTAGAPDLFAYYRADTEPGSSGSPVFNDQWEVVALHHSAVPRTNADGQMLDTSGAVWTDAKSTSEIDWVANEGVRTSRLVKFLGSPEVQGGLTDAQRALLVGALSQPSVDSSTAPQVSSLPNAGDRGGQNDEGPPSAPAPRRPREATPPTPVARAATSLAGLQNVVVEAPRAGAADAPPIRIELTIALKGAPATMTAEVGPEVSFPQERRLVPASGETVAGPGFDPGFLGFPAPLPDLDRQILPLATPVPGGGVELKYRHYSVVFNGARRVAFVSAVNLDTNAPAKVRREGPDAWKYDSRIEAALQAGPDLYDNDPLDKGHLTRRQDAAWGATQAEAQQGNDDTFHWTNCSPQHEIFNRSSEASTRGLLLWGGLENHVTQQVSADKGRASIFNGPVLRSDDREYRGVKLPRQFWKVIGVARPDGRPGAYAFLLSQEGLIRDLPEEGFTPGPYQPYQISLDKLRALTGLGFPSLAAADPLRAPAVPTENAIADVVPLALLSDVVF